MTFPLAKLSIWRLVTVLLCAIRLGHVHVPQWFIVRSYCPLFECRGYCLIISVTLGSACVISLSLCVLPWDFCRIHTDFFFFQCIVTWWLWTCLSNYRSHPILRQRPKMLMKFLLILLQFLQTSAGPLSLYLQGFLSVFLLHPCCRKSPPGIYWKVLSCDGVSFSSSAVLLLCFESSAEDDLFSPALTPIFLKSAQEKLIERS